MQKLAKCCPDFEDQFGTPVLHVNSHDHRAGICLILTVYRTAYYVLCASNPVNVYIVQNIYQCENKVAVLNTC